MRRKSISSNYVSSTFEDSSAETNKSKQFVITLTEKQWVLCELLIENKLLPALEHHLNEAIQNYVEQMASCLTGGISQTKYRNQQLNKMPKMTSYTEEYSDGEIA